MVQLHRHWRSRQGSLRVFFSITLAPTATYWRRLAATNLLGSWHSVKTLECGIFKYQPPFPGAHPEIFYWRGEGGGRGGPNFGSERTPPLSSHRPRLHVIIFWPLTVYGCTRKGYTLGTASSVSAGCRWRWNYCFASRGKQIGGEYPKTIAFFNIPGILSSGKMQRAFH